MAPETIDLDERRDSIELDEGDELETFIRALARSTSDSTWYGISAVEEWSETYLVHLGNKDDPNAIGNAYVRSMLAHGYALEGYSNHGTDGPHIDYITFREIEYDNEDELCTVSGDNAVIHTPVAERLAEIGVSLHA